MQPQQISHHGNFDMNNFNNDDLFVEVNVTRGVPFCDPCPANECWRQAGGPLCDQLLQLVGLGKGKCKRVTELSRAVLTSN